MEIPERDQRSTDESFSFTESLSQIETFQEATLIATLAETFGLTKFKSFQKEIIKAAFAGKDTVVIHPTGSRKSLCFQFPPIYQQNKAYHPLYH